MTEKERLVELLEQEKSFSRYMTDDERREDLADYLLANGVICPPVSVGDKIYSTISGDIKEYPVTSVGKRTGIEYATDFIHCDSEEMWDVSDDNFYLGCHFTDIGKIIFLTRDEAEKALMEREKK